MVGLGGALRRLRKRHNLTIAQLATKAQVRPNTISDIENDHGNPELQTITRLAQAMGLTVAALFIEVTLMDDEAELLIAYRALSATSKQHAVQWVTTQAEVESASARQRALVRAIDQQSSLGSVVDPPPAAREISPRRRRRLRHRTPS